MITNKERVLNDIYSIYKSQYPNPKATKESEQTILDDIQRGIDSGEQAIKDKNIRKVFSLYMNNLKELEALSSLNSDSSATAVADLAMGFFRTQAQLSGTDSPTKTKALNEAINKAVSSTVFGESSNGTDKILDTLVTNGFFTKESADYLKAFIKDQTGGGILSTIMIIIAIISTFTKVSTELMAGTFVKKMNSKFTPNYLDSETLIRALHTAPELTADINKKLSENGLNASDIKLLKVSHYALYDVNQIRESYMRKILTKEQAIARMEELGFTPQRISEIMPCWSVIPGPQDLFWMVGKEAFEPDQIAKFGLGSEFPTEQLKWLEMQGVSEEWAMKYWIAHWDYPSEGRVLELYHRGLIDDDTLDSFYRVIEMPSYWREKLKKASFSLYTRVDLRRMHDMGLITEQDVYDNFRGEGYDDTHAKNMVKFYLKYNEDNNKDLSRSQIEEAYKADLLTKKQAIDMFIKQGYTESQSSFMVEMMDYNELIQMQKLRIKTVQKSFKTYHVSETEARRLLAELNVETKWVDFYIKTWLAETELEEKTPPKEDLISWLQSGLISPSDFMLYMKRLKYSDKVIAIYVAQNTSSS